MSILDQLREELAGEEIERLNKEIKNLINEKHDLEKDLEKSKTEYEEPEWGNCIRGCPPAFIDQEGFCSPSCKIGQPRNYGSS